MGTPPVFLSILKRGTIFGTLCCFSGQRSHFKLDTEDPRYNDSVCHQRFFCKIEFAVIKKLNMDPSEG